MNAIDLKTKIDWIDAQLKDKVHNSANQLRAFRKWRATLSADLKSLIAKEKKNPQLKLKLR